MNLKTYDIKGPILFTPRRFEDGRGYFMETFRATLFADAVAGEAPQFVQDNQSFSKTAGTVRGLHFQSPPHAQGKLVRCTQGAIIDIAVDARKGSSTFGKYVRAELTPENMSQLWVPAGFLHGFSTLTDNTIVQYKCTDYYNSDCDGNVAWNDPELAIDWGINPTAAVLSAKDATAPRLADFTSPF